MHTFAGSVLLPLPLKKGTIRREPPGFWYTMLVGNWNKKGVCVPMKKIGLIFVADVVLFVVVVEPVLMLGNVEIFEAVVFVVPLHPHPHPHPHPHSMVHLSWMLEVTLTLTLTLIRHMFGFSVVYEYDVARGSVALLS